MFFGEIGMPQQVFGFGSFQLNVRERQLTSRGRVIRLHAKVFDTLVVLITDAGRLLRKDALMRAIWPDHVVEENNLQHNICVLRRVLEQHDGENFIETVPGQGYRFAAEVHNLERATHGDALAVPRPAPALLSMRSAPRPAEFPRRQGLATAEAGRFWTANRTDGDANSLNEAELQLDDLLQRLDDLRHSFRELSRELAEVEQDLQQRGVLRAGRLLSS